jgi:hypothetical protein
VLQHPPGSGLAWANLTRGKKQVLRFLVRSEKIGIADIDLPGLAGSKQTRLLGGFVRYGFSVSRPREYGAVYAAKSAHLASVRDATSNRKSRCR